MTGRASNDEPGDVRELLAELEALVDDLGLDEQAAQSPRARDARSDWAGADDSTTPWADDADDDAEAALAAAFATELDAEPVHPALRGGDAEELAQLATALSVPPRPRGEGGESGAVPLWESADASPSELSLWDAFAPELDAAPPRAWSPAAAMAVVEPAAPPSRPVVQGPSRLRRAGAAMRSRLFTAATIAALVVAVGVIALTRLDLGHTSGPVSPVSHPGFAVTQMRTVDALTADAVGTAPTVRSFPASRTAIFMDIAYRNASSADTLRLVITMLPSAGTGGQPISVDDQTHALPQGGEIAVTIRGLGAGFAPGIYTVTAFHDGHLEQSLTFTVESVAPSASPGASPTAPPSASAAPSASASATASPVVR